MPAAAIRVDHVNPFIHSVLNAIETMAFTKAKMGKPFLKSGDLPKCDISGVIGLTGEATGSISINFGQAVACSVISRMLGEEHTEIDAMVKDGVGEIANMTAGGAKGEMQDKGLNFSIALPTVTVGKDHCHSHPQGVKCVVVPFTTDAGDFTIEVALKGS